MLKKSLCRPASGVLLLMILWCTAIGQPSGVVKVKHTYFTSYFSKTAHIPVLVTYWLKSSMFDCASPLDRPDNYGPDPDLSEYTQLKDDYPNTGYDQGHNMSAEDNSCDEDGMNQCFYYTNMTPQPHHFNAGVWKSLEKQEQEAAKAGTRMFIYVGSLGKAKTIGDNRVVVPKFMWKLIYYPAAHRYEAYMFPNTTETEQPYAQYLIKVAKLQQRVGMKFNGQLFKWVN